MVFCTSILCFHFAAASNFSLKFGLELDYLFLNEVQFNTLQKNNISDMESSSKNPFAFHPVIGVDYNINKHWLVGFETGLVVGNDIRNGAKNTVISSTLTDVYHVKVKLFEIPLMLKLRYQFDSGFNVFGKAGSSFVIMKEKLDYERMQNNKTFEFREIDNLNQKGFAPKFAVGFGYQIKEMFDFFVQYSYLHARSHIPQFTSIGAGILINLPI